MQKICRSLSLSPVTEIMEDRVQLGELQRDEAPLKNNKKKLRWVGVVSERAGDVSKEIGVMSTKGKHVRQFQHTRHCQRLLCVKRYIVE